MEFWVNNGRTKTIKAEEKLALINEIKEKGYTVSFKMR